MKAKSLHIAALILSAVLFIAAGEVRGASIKESYKFSMLCSEYGYDPMSVSKSITSFGRTLTAGNYAMAASIGNTLYLEIFKNNAELRNTIVAGEIISNSGYALMMAGYYPPALYYLKEAADFWKDKKGEKDEWYLNTMMNLAQCYMLMADYHKYDATMGQIDAEVVKNKKLRPIYYVLQAEYKYKVGHPAEAIAFLRHTNAKEDADYDYRMLNYRHAAGEDEQLIAELAAEFGGKTNLTLSDCNRLNLLNLMLYWRPERVEEAIANGKKIIDTYKAQRQTLTLSYANILYNQAMYHHVAGKQREALEIAGRALNIYNNIQSASPVDMANCKRMLSELNAALGQYDEAARYAAEVFDLRVSDIGYNMFDTPERREKVWANYGDWYLKTFPRLALLSPSPKMAARAYDAQLIGKGLLLHTERSQADIARAAGGEVENAFAKWDSVRKMLSGPLPLERLEELRKEEEKAYAGFRQLCMKLPEYQSYFNYSWKDVADRLSPGEIAVEFFEYPDGGKKKYGALAVSQGCTAPEIFEACNVDDLADTNPQENTDYSGTVWREILRRYPELRRIWFAPVGAMNLHPVEYSFDGTAIEARRLSSTRVLATPHKAEGGVAESVIFGGLNYNLSPEEMRLEARKYPDLRRGVSGANGREDMADMQSRQGAIEISLLPGTLAELKNIERLLAENTEIEVKTYTGNQGVEESFKSLSGHNPDIIHIGTHGFYFPVPEEGKLPAWMQLDPQGGRDVSDPLTRSGLLMSGAQSAFLGVPMAEGVDDGILTGREIAGMDLSGTALTVLSACESGVGDITGDGVSGLQRAFKKAGAGSLLVSLWEVDDEATSRLMTEFYRNWILKGMDKNEALRRARTRIRTDKRHPEWSAPEFWAPFVLLD